MSAKTYGICPQCMKDAESKRDELIKDLEKNYGKWPRTKFIDKQRELKELDHATTPYEETLAEYYDIGVEADGVFRMRYNCNCDKCGFRFEHQVKPVAAEGFKLSTES